MLRNTKIQFVTKNTCIAYPILGFEIPLSILGKQLSLPHVTQNNVIIYALSSPTCIFTYKSMLNKYPTHNFITSHIFDKGYIDYSDILTNKHMYNHYKCLNKTKILIQENSRKFIKQYKHNKITEHSIPMACLYDVYIDEIIIRNRIPKFVHPQFFVLDTIKNQNGQTIITHIYKYK